MTSLKFLNVRTDLYRLPVLSSPASGIPEAYESIPAFLVPHPCDTFVVPAKSSFEIYLSLHPDDRLVVDRATLPSDGDLAIVAVNGEFVIKQVKLIGDRLVFIPEESGDRLSSPHPEVAAFEFWGVIIACCRDLRQPKPNCD
jgi:SOS-response transcriptional repressor LexA